MIGNVKEALVPFVKQKVKEWKKKKDEAKKKKEEEKKAQGQGTTAPTSTTPDKPTELDVKKTKQPEIEAAMPVYEVKMIHICNLNLYISPFEVHEKEEQFSAIIPLAESKCMDLMKSIFFVQAFPVRDVSPLTSKIVRVSQSKIVWR